MASTRRGPRRLADADAARELKLHQRLLFVLCPPDVAEVAIDSGVIRHAGAEVSLSKTERDLFRDWYREVEDIAYGIAIGRWERERMGAAREELILRGFAVGTSQHEKRIEMDLSQWVNDLLHGQRWPEVLFSPASVPRASRPKR